MNGMDSELSNLPELSSDEIGAIQMLLRRHTGYAGLQETGLGESMEGKSMPRFKPVGKKRFVQILHEYDHWICASNVFGKSTHDVYIYDSMNSTVSKSTIVQVTSLLREEDKPDSINFSIRRFQQQTPLTRICGFYAAAAAISCCKDVDPTGLMYDESLMSQHMSRCLRDDVV